LAEGETNILGGITDVGSSSMTGIGVERDPNTEAFVRAGKKITRAN
jgi:hypothetical protein